MSTSSSTNSTKKKQEEKNLKTLREFLALPSNKTCFDCNQRGPTYVNTTIGSFVCISCSGKLRGLTPPHRVKSVTMASFTQDEIDFLRNRGNEYCRLVWMSHYNMADLVSETKDDQKFKDHLVAKYEKKRWYTDPGAIPSLPSGMTKANGIQGTPLPQASPMPSVTHSPVARPSASVVVGALPSKSSDLLADLDFFTAAPPVVTSTANATSFPSPRSKSTVNTSIPQSASQPSFANFNNADFFFSGISPQKGNGTSQPLVHHAVNGFGAVSPPKEAASVSSTVPPEDRYSALKDLDALFTTATSNSSSVVEPVASVPSSSSSSSAWTPTWAPSGHAGPTLATAPVSHPPAQKDSAFGNGLERWDGAAGFPVAQQPPSNSSNPFLASPPAPTAAQAVSGFGRPALPWANFSTSPSSGFGQPSGINNMNGAGLFPATTNPVAFNGHHSAMMVNPGGGVMTGLSTSQSLDLSPKTWGNASASTMNPFVGAAGFSQGRSHNPFL